MRGLEQKVPPAPGAAMTPLPLLGYLSPQAQAWLPDSARSHLTAGLLTGLRVAAALLCILMLGQMLISQPLAPYRGQILLLLAGAATLTAIGAAEAARRHNQVRAANESLGRLMRAAHAGSIGFWGCDSSGGRFWTTPTSLTVLGLADSPATLEQLVTQLHPGDQALFRETLRRAADSGVDSQCDCRQLRENGVAWLRFNMGAAPEARNQVSGCVTEITERHQLETEVASVRNSLTHLTRVGLLGQLGGALAHELKQPLTAILSNAQALQRLIERKEMDMTEIRAVISDIIQDDTRAAAVIQHLRGLLKPAELQTQLVDMNEIVHETLELVHNEMITRKVAVSAALDDRKLCVIGDQIQLQQLLLNLLFNAADAMATGKGGMVLITTDLVEGPCVHLAVADTGPGIGSSVMEKLFEPFVSTKSQGVGLGLSISRAIVLSHKGRIWAHNNPGRGATFHVALPLASGSP
jgi:signal transduction histidine kinase